MLNPGVDITNPILASENFPICTWIDIPVTLSWLSHYIMPWVVPLIIIDLKLEIWRLFQSCFRNMNFCQEICENSRRIPRKYNSPPGISSSFRWSAPKWSIVWQSIIVTSVPLFNKDKSLYNCKLIIGDQNTLSWVPKDRHFFLGMISVMYLQCMTKCHCQWPLRSKLGKHPQQGVSLYAVCPVSYFPRLASLHWQASD